MDETSTFRRRTLTGATMQPLLSISQLMTEDIPDLLVHIRPQNCNKHMAQVLKKKNTGIITV